jgi:hypothetical protein
MKRGIVRRRRRRSRPERLKSAFKKSVSAGDMRVLTRTNQVGNLLNNFPFPTPEFALACAWALKVHRYTSSLRDGHPVYSKL